MTSSDTAGKESGHDSSNNAKGKQPVTKPSRGVPFLDLFMYTTKTEKIYLIIAALHSCANGVALPCMSLIMGNLINTMTETDPDFWPMIRWFIILMCVAMYTSFVANWIFELYSEKQAMKLKAKFFLEVSRQEIAWFDVNDPGELNSRISEDVVTYREGVGSKVIHFTQFISMFIGGFIIGFIKGWEMTLVVLSVSPLIGFCGKRLITTLRSGQKETSDAFVVAGSIAEEALSNIRTVQSIGAEKNMLQKFIPHLKYAQKVAVRVSLRQGIAIGSMMFSMFGMFALGFWYGGVMVARDQEKAIAKYGPTGCYTPGANCFGAGDVLTVFFAVMMSAMSIGQMATPLGYVAKARVALEKIHETMYRKTKIDSLSTEGKVLDNVEGHITFENIQFTFPSRPDRPVYQNLSFDIPKGKTVALVGASGSGKSSAVQLLMRFYDPDSGCVRLDGHDTRELNIQWLRSQIGIVTQEPRLFATSIMENIRYGKQNATDEECINAAKMANAHSFITTFPGGYTTNVGDGGSQLSGGQKQRIAIARALVRDPSIIILDEATSALDNQSEKIVQEALDKLLLMKSRTTLIIAHRLSTIRNADKIVVLDNSNNLGSIILEQGTHDELLKIEHGIYRALVKGKEGETPTHPEPHTSATTDESPKLDIQKKMSKEEFAARQSSLAALQEKFGQVTDKESHIITKLDSKASVSDILKQVSTEFNSKSLANRKTQAALPVLVEKVVEADKAVTTKEVAVEVGKEKMPNVTKRVFAIVRDELPYILFGFFGCAVRGITFPMFAYLMSEMLNAFYQPEPEKIKSECAKWAYVYIGIGAATLFANFAAYYSFGRCEGKLTARVREVFFKAMLRQDMTFFDNPENSSGTLVSNLGQDATNIKALVSDAFAQVISSVVSLVFALILAFTASWKMTLVMLATLVIMIPGSMLRAKYVVLDQASKNRREKALKEASDENSAGHILNETLASIRIVHALGVQKKFAENFEKKVFEDFTEAKKSALAFGFAYMFSQGAQFACNVVAFSYGSTLIKSGEITVVSMMRVIQAILMAGTGLGQNAVFSADKAKGREAAVRIFNIIDRVPKIDSQSTSGAKPDVQDLNIHFDEAEFRYPLRPDQKVYDGVTFTMPHGKTTALVGASGSGKSTSVQLLERFYNPEGGDIKVGNTSLEDVNIKHWRSQIGLVQQEPILFQGTIAENIKLGLGDDSDKCTDEQIINALKMSNAYNFVSTFPEGIHTQVGLRGGQLSGGQKQRIAIARALIKDPSILILDEATSALDNESERVVQEALDKLLVMKSRTTLVIAHRLTTIRNADQIVVFDNNNFTGSKIIESGNHAELMNIENGTYKKLVEISEGISKKEAQKD